MKRLFYLLVLIAGISYGQNPKVIAHRGASGIAPENTLAAFSKAVEANADYFELDVQISSDDSLMIMHDATVDRTTNGTGTVSSMTYLQLRELDAGSWFGAEFTGERIPTLSEALTLAKNSANSIGVVVELKASDASLPSKVVALIQHLEMESRVIVSSFSLSQITEVKTLDASIPVQLFATITEAHVGQVVAIGGEWVGSGGSFTQEIVDFAHAQGIQYNAWTINSTSQMLPLIALGVDAISTDYPDLMIILMDDTEPSDVVLTTVTALETDVTLIWEPAEDPESGIAGYDVFRDETPNATTLLTSVGNVTEYIDKTYTESHQYYYRIKAKNQAGLSSINYSNEIEVTTLNDVTPPVIDYVTSKGDSTTVVVEFSERVDETTAETTTNYALSNEATVSEAKLAIDLKSVILKTSPLSEQSYLLTVKNVKDRANTPNTMVKEKVIFLHQGIQDSAVAYYKLDTMPIEGSDSLIVDETENLNHGLAKNGAYQTEGILGNALGFDGVDDYVQFESSSSFDINTSAVSISLWTKLAYIPTELPVAYGPLFDSDQDQYVLYEDRGNSELRFKVSTSNGAERPGIPNSDLVAGEWIHLVGVYDGTNAMIYLNGEKKDSHALTGTVKTGQTAYLGRTGATYFEGCMDQIEVYNRALTEEEILEKYNGTKTDPIPLNPGVVTLESATVNETDVTLTWSESVNYESSIMGYEIYRDVNPEPTTLYATVGDITEFVDKTNDGNQTYSYRIKAKNTLGLLSLDYSNEVSATTETDVTRPVVMYVTPKGDTSGVIIEFSEKLNQTTAETVANYAIDQSVVVLDANLALDGKTVFLITTELEEQSYILTINGIQDLAPVPNEILENTRLIFTYENTSSDLVAWYRLNELPIEGADTLVIDETLNENHGVAKNGPVVAEGLLGNSVKFDGDQSQYVQFANSASFDINDTVVSISVWTKLTYLPVEMPVGYGPLFDSQGDEYVIYADRGNKELRFKVSTYSGAERPGIPNADLITGQWINIVAVYDGSNAKIYLNGVLKDSHSITGTVKAGTVPMLARNSATGTSYFTGSIDNVEVFKAALSDAEIVDMYENYRVEAFECNSNDLFEDVSICNGETHIFPDSTTGSETMVHVSYLKNHYGCDSIITTNLTVTTIDVSVSQSDSVVTANTSGAAYQWLDCDNDYAVISGDTNQSYTATVTGNYAVEITLNECVDTSECIYVLVTGINRPESSVLTVYPNPNNGQFIIDLSSLSNQDARFEIINSMGQIVLKEILTRSGKHTVELPSANPGIYIIRVYSDSEIHENRIIIM